MSGDIGVMLDGHVATLELRRPPHNFFDIALIEALADAMETLDEDPACRAFVMAADGKSFCAGANLGGLSDSGAQEHGKSPGGHLYARAVRLFRIQKPILAAIHGPAIGGGLGLAMVADYRVTCAEGRFSANFTRLGFHPGFGLSVTLPRQIGPSRALEMFLTSRRVKGEGAVAIGLADELVPLDQVRPRAQAIAREMAASAPLAVLATRATLRSGLADAVKEATDHELAIQDSLRQTNDFKEGVAAMAERRTPRFEGS
jgi:enoyl-CoA hydratase/carnithine racemase